MLKICRSAALVLLCFLATQSVHSQDSGRFIVPGLEPQMSVMNAIHRDTSDAFTNCTLWDTWLPHGTLWAKDLAAVRYRDVFLQRPFDSDGYVAMQQHRGMAHSAGWPFPGWQQSTGRGWHFSTEGEPWAIENFKLQALTNTEGWDIDGADVVGIDPSQGLKLRATSNKISITTPTFDCDTVVAPFVRLEWSTTAKETPKSQISWLLKEEKGWSDDRSVQVATQVSHQQLSYSNVAMYRHLKYSGLLKKLRWTIDAAPGDEIVLKSIITAIDTRHPITNSLFVAGSSEYFFWTGDVEFLKSNIDRMRVAMEFAIREFDVERGHHVNVQWVGHDGRSGLVPRASGPAQMKPGVGVGNNYWDLLPFGAHDALATMYLYDAMRKLTNIEAAVASNPTWQISAPARSAAQLNRLADDIRSDFQKRFWDSHTQRFVGWIDKDKRAYDYGFTFVNLEAIYYGLASEDQGKQILDWLDGKRTIEGDTSTGEDIYVWRFAPRATTKRNVETYCWVWNNPASIPWGGQIQDGGAVLGFSYYDLVSRLRLFGADNAWARLQKIIAWQQEVDAEGGYRAYYSKAGRGSLQGCGTPGGLGIDCEFMESVLLPQIMIDGFLGLQSTADGFTINPKLPTDWPSLSVKDIHIHGYVFTCTAKPDGSVDIDVSRAGASKMLVKCGNKTFTINPTDSHLSAVPR